MVGEVEPSNLELCVDGLNVALVRNAFLHKLSRSAAAFRQADPEDDLFLTGAGRTMISPLSSVHPSAFIVTTVFVIGVAPATVVLKGGFPSPSEGYMPPVGGAAMTPSTPALARSE